MSCHQQYWPKTVNKQRKPEYKHIMIANVTTKTEKQVHPFPNKTNKAKIN